MLSRNPDSTERLRLDVERSFMASGWTLALQGQEWFHYEHVSPLMGAMLDRAYPESAPRDIGFSTVNQAATTAQREGFVIAEQRIAANMPNARKRTYLHLTDEGMSAAPDMFLQFQLSRVENWAQLQEMLTLPLSRFVQEGTALPQITPEETIPATDA